MKLEVHIDPALTETRVEVYAPARTPEINTLLDRLAAGELLLPWLLRLADARDVPVLTGIFYPFLILPLFCFFSGVSLAKRCRPLWLVYPVLCGVLTLPCVFLLYNSSALFQVWVAVIAALAGSLLGVLLREKSEKT